MDIKNLEARMWYLAGQIDEAKRVYKEALGEVQKNENANQKERIGAESGSGIGEPNKEVQGRESAAPF